MGLRSPRSSTQLRGQLPPSPPPPPFMLGGRSRYSTALSYSGDPHPHPTPLTRSEQTPSGRAGAPGFWWKSGVTLCVLGSFCLSSPTAGASGRLSPRPALATATVSCPLPCRHPHSHAPPAHGGGYWSLTFWSSLRLQPSVRLMPALAQFPLFFSGGSSLTPQMGARLSLTPSL